MSARGVLAPAVLAVLVLGLAGLSLAAGRVWIPLAPLAAQDPRWLILTELRLPRTALAMLVGAALGASGAVLQGYTRNALADPGALGVSSMAALGAVACLFFGAAGASPWVVAACGMAGAAAGVLLLLALAAPGGETAGILLVGMILNTIASAGVALALSLAPNPWAASEITTWLMGSLADRSVLDLRIAAPFVVAGGAVLLGLGRALDALTLGETGARALGVSLGRLQAAVALGVGLACGAAVSVTGVIGFVGLIAPHLIRPLVGPRPSRLVVPSAMAGAALLLGADILTRLTPGANEVRVDVAMAVVGGPFFLALLIARRRRLA